MSIEKDEMFKRLGILTGKANVDRIAGYRLPSITDTPKIDRDGSISLASKALAVDQSSIALEKDLENARWGPSVDFEGRAGRLPSEGVLYPHEPRFDLMIVAKWDLFNGAQKRAELQEIVAKEKKLEALVQYEKVSSANTLAQILASMENLRRKSQISQNNRQAASRYYKASMSEYERGIKNSPDVAHATEILFENDYRELELRFNWAKEKISLERVLSKNL
jgi:outer membrane protein TolC